MTDQRYSTWFIVVVAFFLTTLIVSNIIAVKLVTIFGYAVPAGIIIFPISYIFGDILTEVYGYAKARRVIWLGFGCNLFAVVAIWVGGLLPAAPFWTAGEFGDPASAQQAYMAILGFTPRLLAASFVAYLFGEFLNSFVLAKLKLRTAGRLLWLRTVASTLAGQLADSGVFILIAFGGRLPSSVLGQLALTQWLFKSAYEAAVTPLTYAVINFLKRVDGVDYYDRETNFNPLALAE